MKIYLLTKRWYDNDKVIRVYVDKDEAIGALQYCKMSNTVLSFNIQEWDTETQEVEDIAFKSNPNEELLYDV